MDTKARTGDGTQALVWTDAPATVQHGKRNPAEVYLASLAESGRYTMRRRLRLVAAILLGEENAEDVPEGTELAAPLHTVRYEHVVGIRTVLQELGLAPATVNAALCAIRGVARESFNLELLSADELKRIEQVKGVKGTRLPKGRALQPGEIAALFRACEADEGPAGPRDAAMLALMYVGGLRRAEVAALDLADYDSDAGELVVRGKGNTERLVHLQNGGTAGALGDWLSIRGDHDGALFVPVNKGGNLQHRRMSTQAVYNTLRRRAKQAGVTESTPHDMRRTFISDLLDAGADISVVQQMAGHASIQTTARYDRRGEKAKRQAAGLLHVPYTPRVRD